MLQALLVKVGVKAEFQTQVCLGLQHQCSVCLSGFVF